MLGLVVNGRLRYEDAQGNVITSVNVPAGARNATFRVRPEGVLLSTNVPVTVTEQVSAVSVSSTLTVLPSVFSGGVVLQPTTVASGNRSNGTLNLNGTCPAGGRRRQSARQPEHRGLPQRRGADREQRGLPRRRADGGIPVTTPSLGFNETQTVTVVAEMAVSGFSTTAQLTIRGPAKPKEKDKNEKAEIKEQGEKVQLEKALPQENIAVQPSPGSGEVSTSGPCRRRRMRGRERAWRHPQRPRRRCRRRRGGPSSRRRGVTTARRRPSPPSPSPSPSP